MLSHHCGAGGHLSRLFLLPPLLLLRLHQSLLGAQQLLVEDVSLVLCLSKHTHMQLSFNTVCPDWDGTEEREAHRRAVKRDLK